jgi:hypothetical protein
VYRGKAGKLKQEKPTQVLDAERKREEREREYYVKYSRDIERTKQR